MNYIQAVSLGLVQGLTEFLPVSSSGHLVLVSRFLHWSDQGIFFDLVLHLGTLLAVIIYYRHKIKTILRSVYDNFKSKQFLNFKDFNYRLFWYLIFSVIPAGIFGLLVGKIVETKFRSPDLIAFNLIVWGLVLGLGNWWQRKVNLNLSLKKMLFFQVLMISLAQSLALIPGTSRSGITMSVALLMGFSREASAEFSFLMSLPVIFLAGLWKTIQVVNQSGFGLNFSYLIIGFLSAFMSGYLAIWLLLKIIKKKSFLPFVVYRLILGLLIFLILYV